MTVTFAANYMNHHQLPFSEELLRLTDGGYHFAAFTPLRKERASLGYSDLNDLPFVIRVYNGHDELEEAKKHIINDDMVIFGTCPDEMLELRRNSGKPFIIYSERFFKKGTWRRFVPKVRRQIERRILQFNGDNAIVICSSAYLPYDLSLLGSDLRTYKWGYFPECRKYDIEDLMSKKARGEEVSILWAARMISWKHPETALFVARELKRAGVRFKMTMLGDGELLLGVRKKIRSYGLDGYVEAPGSVMSDKVRDYMEKADIFLMTSDRQEGWGAVAGEAMNSGCAVVACRDAGSVPFLIEDGKTGLVFGHGDKKSAAAAVKQLCNDPEKRSSLGRAAYTAITEEWNATVAASRLYEIISARVDGRDEPVFESGPCSVADIIK